MYTFLVISFARYNEYMIFLISFTKFSDVLPAFTCASAIGNLRSIYLGIKILRLELFKTLSKKPVDSIFIVNILLSKASRTFSLSSKSAYKFSRTSFFFYFFSRFRGFILILKL